MLQLSRAMIAVVTNRKTGERSAPDISSASSLLRGIHATGRRRLLFVFVGGSRYPTSGLSPLGSALSARRHRCAMLRAIPSCRPRSTDIKRSA